MIRGLAGTNIPSGAITALTTFTISCDGGIASDSVIVNVNLDFEEF